MGRSWGSKKELDKNEEKVVVFSGTIRNFISPRAGNTKDGQWVSFGLKLTKSKDNIHITKYGTVSCNGCCPILKKDTVYKIRAIESFDETYGYSYKIDLIGLDVTSLSKAEQKQYLLSVIGESKTELLYSNLSDPIKVLENEDIETLCKIKGIRENSAKQLIKKYNGDLGYAEAISLLKKYDMTDNQIKGLVDKFGSGQTIENKIKKNPYFLLNAKGYGWEKTDKIARASGIKPYDKRRIEAYVEYFLQSQAEAGNSWVYQDQLWNGLCENLGGNLPDEVVGDVIHELEEGRYIVFSKDRDRLGLKTYYDLELSIAKELIRLVNAKSNLKVDNIEEKIEKAEEEQGYKFTDEQRNAIELISTENVVALTGLAGSGKTSTIKGMVGLFKENYSCIGCSLSGKASLRITEGSGLEAMTIHRLLQFKDGRFLKDKFNQLKEDVFVMDESTMTNGELFLSFLKAIPSGSKLILAGDVQQLTPIGSCQVFADILEADKFPKIKLTKPHRQALRGGIVPTSLQIVNQQSLCEKSFHGRKKLGELQDLELDVFDKNEDSLKKVIEHFWEQYNIEKDIMNVQVICLMKTRGDLSCYNINNLIQEEINPITEKSSYFKVTVEKDKVYRIQAGDKVINIKNNYNTMNKDGVCVPIFNGSMGLVKEIIDTNVIVDFEGIGEIVLTREEAKSLWLAYAITLHKSQGSQFNRVIFTISDSDYILINVESGYTGITRAKQFCEFMFTYTAMQKMIRTKESKNKQTYLKSMLNHSLK